MNGRGEVRVEYESPRSFVKFKTYKFIKVKQSDPHWISNNIKQMMRKRKRLYDKYKRTKNASDLQNFKQYRNKITRENLKKLKLIN